MDQTIFIDYNMRVKELDLKLEQLNTNESINVDSSAVKDLLEKIISLEKALNEQALNYPEGPAMR